ncbi:MAG: RDD family protein [Ignavibacteria bacterium]|nr:RDD family protein [Ignavibacteria bacterium]
MAKISIDTAQNITIEVEPASVSSRMFAYILDMIFLVIIGLVVFFGIFGINRSELFSIPQIIMIVLILTYDLYCEFLFNGQTLGKYLMKIRVVSLDGSKPDFLRLFIRWLFRIVDISSSVGAFAVIIISMSGKGQRLGDIVAKTTVVSLDPPKVIESEAIESFPNSYTITFPQAEYLTEEDIRLIQDVLDSLDSLADQTRLEVMYKLLAKIEKKTGKLESYMSPPDKLRKIIKDYTYIHTQAV